MKRILYLLFPVLSLFALCSCEDNADDVDNSEFTQNWNYRNALYFAERLDEAKKAIAEARQTYGDDWEEHCDWRLFRSYAKMPGGIPVDTICARIVERGNGSTARPLYTDSVKVCYMGRLIPTQSYPEGRVFDHTGLYENEDYVFNPNFATPGGFSVSGVIEGFTTALLYMRVGDRWKVYIPQELGYLGASTPVIPAYSTLIYDMQLKAIYRAGSFEK